MILGGPALFLAGHAAFKYVLWGIVPWTRLAGIAVLALLALAVPALPEIALAACAAAVVAMVAAADRRRLRPARAGGERASPLTGAGRYSSSESLTTLMLSLASRNETSSSDLAIENSRYGTAACASPLSILAASRSCGE